MRPGEGPAAVFELSGAAQAGTGSEVLGLWTTGLPFGRVYPEPSRGAQGKPFAADAVAFDTTLMAAAEALVWRANLPADLNLAAEHLANAKASLDASQAALAEATDRIDALVEGRSTGLAFDVSAAGTELAQPERELLAWLEEAQESGPRVSFRAAKEAGSGWEQAAQQFQGFVDHLRQIVAHYAWVETRVQGQLLGRTAVLWTGDVDTVWQGGLDAAPMVLHQRTLTLALACRDTLIRTFVLALSGAARLSVLLAMPGGAILALPAAWKFINQVRAELEKHQQITKEVKNG